jgi:alpha-tubulin suppressor-like RCC1 family protein
MGKE